LRIAEFVNFNCFEFWDCVGDKLADSIATFESRWNWRVTDQQSKHLTAEVSIHCAWRIDQRDKMLRGKAGTRTTL
jgi:hypothetical protein